ncbi:monocarboxylate transporter 12-B-like isoform X2 [Acanthaster planci]|uniref:Monocarboxylate transporter 12-B-like isoform X2 n=1 Tax=Acanthaster planci TaxID=133434 RepID=A0A8B7Y348_ACAPL|nr:monocarboxylate transporter 12-B-like isoform X2 [Acanthaster planci]
MTLPRRWIVLLARTYWAFIALGTYKALAVFIPLWVDELSTTTTSAGFVCSMSIGLGAISGIGQAATQLASAKAVMDYFPDNFAAANGVSLSGGPLGMMILPPVTEYIVSVYGWRAALCLLGAFSFNYTVCGALFRPRRVSCPTFYSVLPNQTDTDNTSITSKEEGKRDVKCGGSLTKKMLNIVHERFDTNILTQDMFLVYQLVTILCGALFSSWHLFVIPQGIELGFGEVPSAVLATFGGIGSLVGRSVHGPLVDYGLIKSSTLFVISSLVFAASTLTNPLVVQSYFALAFLCTIAGFAMGILYPMMFVLVREVTGDQHLSAFSWLFVSLSAGELAGGVLAGWIHDLTGAYEPVFVTIGGMAVITSTLVAFTQCVISCCRPENK